MKLVYGIGINDADYPLSKTVNGKRERCPFYKTWLHMLIRCYSDEYKKKYPTYQNCSVCSEWLSFMAFRSWMMTQEWEGKQLDKDIIKQGNKVYGPDFCAFVTCRTNNFILKKEVNNGLPCGVYFDSYRNCYSVGISAYGKTIKLGRFKDLNDAALVWRKKKKELALELAAQQTDIRVRDAICQRYQSL